MAVRVVVALTVALCTTTLPAGASGQVLSPRTVLTIHLGAETFPSSPILDAGIREALAARSDVPVDYFAEYLESDLFPGEDASLAFRDYIRRKYQGRRIDLVIAIADETLRFVLKHRAELFPEAPIVFTGLAVPDEMAREAGGGITGIKVGVAYTQTLGLALQLQPSTEHVFVVVSGTDKPTVESVRNQFRDLPRPVDLRFINEDTVPHLLAAVESVPPRSVILYIWHFQYKPGSLMYADEVARLVARAAPVPVYGTSDFYIGSGVVGGVVRDTRETGTHLGEMAVRILTGTRAQDIPIEVPRLLPYLDWRQLQRWGITAARVPAGALIKFREPSIWEQYKLYALGAVMVLLAQTALIAGLLVQRKRRRQAEEQVRGSQAELRASYEQIRHLGSRLLNAQDAERSRIARELHDDISQQVALLAIDLGRLRGSVQGQGEELRIGAVTRAHGLARSVHDLSHRLHPAKLQLIGLVPALDALQRELSRPDLAVTFTHDNVPPSLAPELTLCLFRIVQEALQNALKHSKAREVSVHLHSGPEEIVLTIVDDGVGFDIDRALGKGLGLISMRERLEPVGGRLEVRSTPGAGTRLEVRVPLPAAHSAEYTPPDKALAW